MQFVKYFMVILAILLLGLFDVSEQWLHFSHSKQDIQQLKMAIHTQKIYLMRDNKITHKPSKMSKEKVIDLFLTLVELSGLSLQSFSVIDPKEIFSFYQVQGTVLGNYHQIMHLFEEISKQCLPFNINALQLEKNQNQLKLRFSLNIMNNCVINANAVFMRTQQELDPFFYFFLHDSAHDIQHFSIKQLKFAGFLQYRDHAAAIILLPTKLSKEVVVGDWIGLEHAKVVRIDDKMMLIEWQGKNIPINSEK